VSSIGGFPHSAAGAARAATRDASKFVLGYLMVSPLSMVTVGRSGHARMAGMTRMTKCGLELPIKFALRAASHLDKQLGVARRWDI
jgi:hypothetical protein